MEAALRIFDALRSEKKKSGSKKAGGGAKATYGATFVKGTGYGGGAGAGLSKADMNRSAAVAASNNAADQSIESSLRTITREMTVESKGKMIGSTAFISSVHSLLRNDSLFDISERGGLYRALLDFLSAVAQEPFLASLLTCRCPSDDGEDGSGTIISLLCTLSSQASQFVRLRQGSAAGDDDGTLEQALLMALHIEATSAECSLRLEQAQALCLVPLATEDAASSSSSSSSSDRSTAAGAEQARRRLEEEEYLRELRPLRFEAVSLLDDIAAGKASHLLFKSGAASAAAGTTPSTSRGWTARVAAEMSGLMSSLPVYPASAVFVRCDEARMDVVKALVVAPEDTPYANGCFEFDILLPPTYPNVPPKVLLCTTGGGKVRFNPNLYNCGKVCLSLLGTWAGPGWVPRTSTLLQVLVSIQSLIFVGDPYFNEPGHERSINTPLGKAASKKYNAQVCCDTARYAILEQIKKPSPAFRDVIKAHFRIKRETVLKQLREWAGQCPPIREIEKLVVSALKSVAAPIVLDGEPKVSVAPRIPGLGAAHVPNSRAGQQGSSRATSSTGVCVDLCSDDEDIVPLQSAKKRQKVAYSSTEVINLT
jgi:ubiquitin-protein ligase